MVSRAWRVTFSRAANLPQAGFLRRRECAEAAAGRVSGLLGFRIKKRDWTPSTPSLNFVFAFPPTLCRR